MIRVRAPSRLHFGMLSLPASDAPGVESNSIVRSFGGVGLMIDKPGLTLSIEQAHSWSAEGILAERALEFARHFADSLSEKERGPPCRLHIESCPDEHIGLGTGTQLGLAVARALALAWNLPPADAPTLAKKVGRGVRSALGVHGFERGGFLVEAGKLSSAAIAPLVARETFPADWRVLLVMPKTERGLHGTRERRIFQRLLENGVPQTQTDTLCRLVLLGMLPALAEQDWHGFGEAVYEFNRRNGEIFKEAQGGIYASTRLRELANSIRAQSFPGVGQSSWGPALFACTPDQPSAERMAHHLTTAHSLSPDELLIASADNQGAQQFG